MGSGKFVVTVKRSRLVEGEDGNFRREHLPDEQHVVEVQVDLEKLAATLGPKAVLSKGGKAIEASGMVIVRSVRQLIPSTV